MTVVCCPFECMMSWTSRHVSQKYTLFLEPTFFCFVAKIIIISWYNHFLLCGRNTYIYIYIYIYIYYVYIISWYNLFLLGGRNIHCFIGTAFFYSLAEMYIISWYSLFLLSCENVHYSWADILFLESYIVIVSWYRLVLLHGRNVKKIFCYNLLLLSCKSVHYSWADIFSAWWHPCTLFLEPAFFHSSLVKSTSTWLSPEEFDFGSKKHICHI